MTTLLQHPMHLPFKTNEHNVVFVGGTRVTLDTLIYSFKSGASAEQIAQQYPSLALDDVYVAIAYYLRNVEAVEAYLHDRADARDAVRRENQSRFDPAGIRDRLLARKQRNV